MKKSIVVGTALMSVLVMTSCAGTTGTSNGDSTGGLDPASPVKISVAETAGAPSAFLQYGVDQGFFTDEGLDLEVDVSAGGAAAIPGLVSGNYQFAGSNVVSVILAAVKGLPVTIVAAGTRSGETTDQDFSSVLVRADSDITSPADLAGKTVAVNTLQNISEVSVRAALDNENVDTSEISFIEMGFPEMLPALDGGHVDAVMAIEPFATTGLEAGDRSILSPYVQAMPGLMVGSYATTNDYLASNPEVVEAFRRGVAGTGEAIASDPAAFRTALPDLAKVQPDAAKAMILPVWNSAVDVDSLSFIEDRMRAYGLTTDKFDVSSIVAPAGSE